MQSCGQTMIKKKSTGTPLGNFYIFHHQVFFLGGWGVIHNVGLRNAGAVTELGDLKTLRFYMYMIHDATLKKIIKK